MLHHSVAAAIFADCCLADAKSAGGTLWLLWRLMVGAILLAGVAELGLLVVLDEAPLPFLHPSAHVYVVCAWLGIELLKVILLSAFVCEDATLRGRPPFAAALMTFFGWAPGLFTWIVVRPPLPESLTPPLERAVRRPYSSSPPAGGEGDSAGDSGH
jgi:hypothetical protein